jgi:hypothetical protein
VMTLFLNTLLPAIVLNKWPVIRLGPSFDPQTKADESAVERLFSCWRELPKDGVRNRVHRCLC